MDTPKREFALSDNRYMVCPWCIREFDLWKATDYKVYAMLISCPHCHRPMELEQKVYCKATPVCLKQPIEQEAHND
jgi:hypothetical protein